METNTQILRKNILPALGHMTLNAIMSDDLKRWFALLSEPPGIANRAMLELAVMMRMAEFWGYRAHNTDHCKRTRRYATKPNERFLDTGELARLGLALDAREAKWHEAVAATTLLALTDC
ncbi:MAG: hypothetical protein OXH83_02440 [Bryobacterales bacterium]|nr:hypothetical protein [Bryobacterales bacterium]